MPADLVVLSADPCSVYTNVLETWVEGEKELDRSDAEVPLYATGGFGASHPLAKKIGAWPSVLTVAGIAAASAWVLNDRKP